MSEDVNRDQLVRDIQALIAKKEIKARSFARWEIFLRVLGIFLWVVVLWVLVFSDFSI